MAITYYMVLTSYSKYGYEFIWNKAITADVQFLHSPAKGCCWSVLSCEYGLRPAYDQNYCLQLATLPAASLFSPVFPFQHPIHCAPWQLLRFQKLSAFTSTSASRGVGLQYTTEFLPLSWAAFPSLWITTRVFSEFWWSSSSGPAQCSCGCDAWEPAAPQHHCCFKLMMQNISRYCTGSFSVYFVIKRNPCLALHFFIRVQFGLCLSLVWSTQAQ